MTAPGSAGFAELGPVLGRLTEVVGRVPEPDLPLDRVRLELVTTLFALGAEARRALESGDPVGARVALDRARWLEIWGVAVAAVSEVTAAAIEGRLNRAARRSGAPSRRLAALRPSEEDRTVIRARLDAAGIPLEAALERPLADWTDWPQAIRRSAGALEESWDELETVARREGGRWQPRVAALEAWRPPLAAYAIPAALLGLTALGIGLAIGGYLPRPAWLDPLAAWFWSLPWP